MTVSKGRTDAERHAGRASVRSPATLAVLDLCGAGRRLCAGRPGREPGLSRFRGQNAVVALCRREGTRSRPSMGGAGALAESLGRTVGGRHRQRERRSPRREAPHAVRAGSRERLLKRFATAPTGDQDAAVSDRPRNRAPNPRMTGELAIPVPHGALERKRQLVAATPSLDIDELVAHQATERDRPRTPPVPGATRERDERDHRAAALELLPHSLASHQFTTSRPQPGAMRLGSLTTRRRAARVAPKSPCTSDSAAPAIRAPRADTPPARNGRCMRPDACPDTAFQALPGTRGTTHPATHGGRSQRVPSPCRRTRSRAAGGLQSRDAAANRDRVGELPSAPERPLQRPSWTLLSAQLGP